MRDINFGTPYSFLGSIWFLKKELKNLGSGQHVISDNNPSLEFYLNFPKVISNIEKIVINRAPFEDVWGKITQSSYFLSKAQKVTFKKHWDSRLNSESAEVAFNLGIALFAEGKNEEAIGYFKEAIRIRPGFAAAQKNLETALRSMEMQDLF